jgi:hypothetical protein
MASPTSQASKEKARAAQEKAASEGEVSPDGRTYTNPAVGFSLRIPEPLTGWTLLTRPTVKSSVMEVVSPGARVRIYAFRHDFPAQIPPDEVTGFLGTMMKGMFPGFSLLRQEVSERGALRFQDLWFEATVRDEPVKGVLRYLGRGTRAYLLIARGLREDWEPSQAEAVAILDTFTLLEPSKGEP